MFTTQSVRDECLKRFEMLESDLRTGSIDHRLYAYMAKLQDRGIPWLKFIPDLLKFMYEEELSPAIEVKLPEVIHPDGKVLELLSRYGLNRLIYAYLSRFSGPFSGEVARAFELLQVFMFTEVIYDGRDWSSLGVSDSELQYFRLAQKLRNENGFTRSNSLPDCSESFEDIINMERISQAGDVTPVIVQCFRLELLEGRHIRNIHRCALTFSQLLTVHRAVSAYGCGLMESFRRSCFFSRFESLLNEMEDPQPPWEIVKVYLKAVLNISGIPPTLLGENIRDSEINEALNCVLNGFTSLRDYYLHGDTYLTLPMKLLERGASLYYRHPDEEMSSIAALVKIAQHVKKVDITKFALHMCCHLIRDDETLKVIPDPHKPTPLVCLCARKLPPGLLEEQWTERLIAEAHQELQTLLDREPYTPTGHESRWAIDMSDFSEE